MVAPLRISVFDSKELQAAVLAIRAANKEVQGNIRQYTKAELLPVFQEEMRQNASTQLEAYALGDTARVAVSNQTVRLSTASVGAKLSGGLDVKSDYAPIEFGASPEKTKTFEQTSSRGKKFTVTKHVHRQFRPPRRGGYVFYPTVSQLIPRFASLWIQTAIRTIGDAIDKAGSVK